MLYTGGCDTCYIQEVVIQEEVVIHVNAGGCDTS